MRRTKTTGRASFLGALVATGALFLATASPAAAVGEWKIVSLSNPTAAPGTVVAYRVTILNMGDEKIPATLAGDESNCSGGPAPENCYTVTAEFPPGLTPVEATTSMGPCSVVGADSITCSSPGAFESQQLMSLRGRHQIVFRASVDPGVSGTLVSFFEVSGAGAGSASTVDPTAFDPAPPEFGVADFDTLATADEAGGLSTEAGAHPFEFTTFYGLESYDDPDPFIGPLRSIKPAKDVLVELPPGFVGNPASVEVCPAAKLLNGFNLSPEPLCPPESQVGSIFLHLPLFEDSSYAGPGPLFALEPPPGVAARFGFNVAGTVVTLDATLREHDYGLSVASRNTPQGLDVQGADVILWGVPADESHDGQRACPGKVPPVSGGPTCPNAAPEVPFFRNPTACTPAGVGLPTTIRIDSWADPGDFDSMTIHSHKLPGYPADPSQWGAQQGPEECEGVPVEGELDAKPTSRDAETSSGLGVHVEIPNPGLENPTGIASSDLKKVKVSLPQGVTLNPSQAEGLGVCSRAQYESSALSFLPDNPAGCPEDSKIGTVEVVTPLLEEKIPGEVFIAKPFDNPFDSLLAIYIVLEEPQRGVLVKLAGKVETDEKTGKIVTTFDDLPQQPFSSFDFKFREGARAPLVTPPACGTYTTETEITGWSSVDPVTGKVDPEDVLHRESSFTIDRGIGGGPCPSRATPGFDPGFSAGTINNAAGAFSPTTMRLTRKDGEQDLTKFSAVLPEGLLAKLAGVEQCSEAAITSAETRTGLAELASPSCPANSRIGRTLAGAGVGSVLTYVPGSLYLAGPYKGAPLSVVSITPAVAGPFDVGVVVVREALSLDPVSGVASVDGTASDPIPHILKGIPLKLRDLRVYVDRQSFTLNPTSCEASQIGATLWGSAADVFSPADDLPVGRAARFQAAACGDLGFKPRLKLKLKGGMKRGGHPALQALLKPRPGDANFERVQVLLPGTELLENSHIRTICTRVQFAANGGHGAGCPKGSVYGQVKAWTPLLDEPLQGPVYLRSSDHQLPDMVLALSGIVEIEAVGRIDSKNGRIRATFERIPDAPLAKVLLQMQGARKGLLVNAADVCKGKPRAKALMDGQNGKPHDFRPRVRGTCGKRRKR